MDGHPTILALSEQHISNDLLTSWAPAWRDQGREELGVCPKVFSLRSLLLGETICFQQVNGEFLKSEFERRRSSRSSHFS
jgi:hypothetical protein